MSHPLACRREASVFFLAKVIIYTHPEAWCEMKDHRTSCRPIRAFSDECAQKGIAQQHVRRNISRMRN